MRRLLLLLLFISGFWFFILSTPRGFTATPAAPTKVPKALPVEGIKSDKAPPAIDPAVVYKKNCGQCHMAFPPDFLPSGSWEKLMGSLEKHFEDSVEIDQKTLAVITPYLKNNGAEFSKAKIPQKIMQSLEGRIPLRITEIPYIVKKHRRISPEDFKRKPIGSFSNCGACHLLADDWIFNKQIVIPDYEGALPKD